MFILWRHDKFVQSVIDYSVEYKPNVIIIHSTIPVGTTKKIEAELEKCFVVHSPVRGVHPNLTDGLKTFVKYIGYNHKVGLNLAEEHFHKIGIKTKPIENTDSTELAKMLSTSYYGLVIAWHGEMKKMCDKYNVSFLAIKDWTHTYNEGYLNLGMMNVVRPNLVPPGNHIGGHCVIPNARLLKQTEESIALDLILEYE